MRENPMQPNLDPGGIPQSWRFWLLVLATGVGAGLGAGLLMTLLRAVQHFFWSYSAGEFVSAVHNAGPERRVAVLVLAGLIAGSVRWLMQLQSGASAIDLSEAIWSRAGRLPPFQAVSQSVLSIVIVGMGASLGREGAPKLTGAAVANVLSSWTKLSDAERRLLVACGAGAGMGAVYNVPFGGALFALEVLLGALTLPLVLPAILTSLVATWVSWLFLPDQPTYNIPVYAISTGQIVWAFVAGPIAGLAAVLYVRAIAWADARKPKGWRLLIVPLIVFAVLGLLALPFPEVTGNGKDVVYSVFLDQLDVSLMLPLLLLKPLMTCACLGSGAPGGLFTPTLTFGALLGALLGRLWAAFWPGTSPGSYAIIGAGALLAAAMQAPIASIVLMLELAPGRGALTVPLMLAVAGAVLVGGRLERRTIYSGRIHAKSRSVEHPMDSTEGHSKSLSKSS